MNRILRTIGMLLCVSFLGITGANAASDIPPLNGERVNDNAALLTNEQHTTLAAALADIETKTTAQVAILTVKTVPPGYDMNKFKVQVFAAWKLGQKGKDNGLLIVYAANADDGKDHYGIETGYGLEALFPDAAMGDIIRNDLRAHADPKHGTHDFYTAFSNAAKDIGDRIAAEAAQSTTAEPKGKTGESLAGWYIFGGIILLGIVIVVIVSTVRSGSRSPSDDTFPIGPPFEDETRRGYRTTGRSPSSSRRASRRSSGDDSFLTGAVLGSALSSGHSHSSDSSSSGGSDFGNSSSGGFSDGGFSGGGGSSGGGGASD